MNEVKDAINDLTAVEGIEITVLNDVDPVNDGGGEEGGYFTLTIVLTICA